MSFVGGRHVQMEYIDCIKGMSAYFVIRKGAMKINWPLGGGRRFCFFYFNLFQPPPVVDY